MVGNNAPATKKDLLDVVDQVIMPSFDRLYREIDDIKAHMVTKSYLDDKLVDRDVRHVRRFKKMTTILRNKGHLNQDDVMTIERL